MFAMNEKVSYTRQNGEIVTATVVEPDYGGFIEVQLSDKSYELAYPHELERIERMKSATEVDKKVIQGMRNALAQRGADWTYPENPHPEGKGAESDWYTASSACVNLLPDGSAGCVIGFIAVDQGLPTVRESFAKYDADNWGVSSEVAAAMHKAQVLQDEKYPLQLVHDEFFKHLDKEGLKY